VASTDVSLARMEDAPRRTAGTAAFLLEVIAPVLPPEVSEADVTAVFGAPGTWGLGISAHALRAGDGWATSQKGTVHPVLVPPLPGQLTRPTHGERAATEAARTFLQRADEGDGDGVWDLTSAAVKATTSRRSFEQAHWPDGWKAPRGSRREQFKEYEVHTGDFKVGDILQVCFVTDGDIDAVQVRLDDDQEWRVSDFARRPMALPEAPPRPWRLRHRPGRRETWLNDGPGNTEESQSCSLHASLSRRLSSARCAFLRRRPTRRHRPSLRRARP
jgi:hypothetical protein